MTKPNKTAIKTWTLRIETLEAAKSEETNMVARNAIDQDLDLAWRRLREAQGVRV